MQDSLITLNEVVQSPVVELHVRISQLFPVVHLAVVVQLPKIQIGIKHLSVVLQLLPQDPQLFTSSAITSTHVPLHRVYGT